MPYGGAGNQSMVYKNRTNNSCPILQFMFKVIVPRAHCGRWQILRKPSTPRSSPMTGKRTQGGLQTAVTISILFSQPSQEKITFTKHVFPTNIRAEKCEVEPSKLWAKVEVCTYELVHREFGYGDGSWLITAKPASHTKHQNTLWMDLVTSLYIGENVALPYYSGTGESRMLTWAEDWSTS